MDIALVDGQDFYMGSGTREKNLKKDYHGTNHVCNSYIMKIGTSDTEIYDHYYMSIHLGQDTCDLGGEMAKDGDTIYMLAYPSQSNLYFPAKDMAIFSFDESLRPLT